MPHNCLQTNHFTSMPYKYEISLHHYLCSHATQHTHTLSRKMKLNHFFINASSLVHTTDSSPCPSSISNNQWHLSLPSKFNSDLWCFKNSGRSLQRSGKLTATLVVWLHLIFSWSLLFFEQSPQLCRHVEWEIINNLYIQHAMRSHFQWLFRVEG